MTKPDLSVRLIAFSDGQCVVEGKPEQVVTYLKGFVENEPEKVILILDAFNSRVVELDLRPSVEEVLATQFSSATTTETSAGETDYVGQAAKRGRGRPKLGVVSREITLLPRHWDWLAKQPGGASVALRRLVDEARNTNGEKDKLRAAQDSAYRFMTTMAGDEQGYEEAVRSLYAGDLSALRKIVKKWPPDIARHAELLASSAVS